ncbi:MAG: sensor domain-containing diguanylate cyclase [Acidobacteriota bacterium]|jgi:diguanylate cyclase (GGDEF)-like protein/PAS domain S-box-containing protein|nr:sensor domain-containing diguanylate cyclase [Acidobacteriota bacterium]
MNIDDVTNANNVNDANIDAAILDAFADGIYCVDRDMTVLRWNRATREITGYGMEDLAEKTCRGNLRCHVDGDSVPLCDDQCLLQATLADGQSRSATMFVRNRDAQSIPVFVKTVPIHANGSNGISGGNGSAGGSKGVAAVFAILSPCSEGMRGEMEDVLDSLPEIALTDRLTGLYNRRYFEGEVGVRISRRREEDKRAVLSFFAIDDFNAFRDTYGHDASDEVLRKAARALEAGFRKTDIFCRWGGGAEFVCLHDFSSVGDLDGIGRKLQKTVASVKIDWYGEVLSVTASIGVTEIRADDTIGSVIHRADSLMCQSRQNGNDRYTIE